MPQPCWLRCCAAIAGSAAGTQMACLVRGREEPGEILQPAGHRNLRKLLGDRAQPVGMTEAWCGVHRPVGKSLGVCLDALAGERAGQALCVVLTAADGDDPVPAVL